MAIEHSVLGYAENHVVHAMEFASITARDAYTVVAGDLYKLCRITGGTYENYLYMAISEGAGDSHWVTVSAPDDVVTLDGTQTLTNKTLTAPRINNPKFNEDVECDATSTEINTCCDGATAKNSHTHTLSDISDIDATGAELEEAASTFMLTKEGDMRRSNYYRHSTDVDQVIFPPAWYYHHGNDGSGENQIVYWTSDITFYAGVAGAQSNNDNDQILLNTWTFFYLDDSAIITKGDNIITASEILNENTAPTWNDEKFGWYNGDDRCIGMAYGSANDTLEKWVLDPVSGMFLFANSTQVTGPSQGAYPTGAAQALSKLPLSTPLIAKFTLAGYSTTTNLRSFYVGSASSSLHVIYLQNPGYGGDNWVVNLEWLTDSSKQIWLGYSNTDMPCQYLYYHGFYFPQGM